jgi:hypothetical protein
MILTLVSVEGSVTFVSTSSPITDIEFEASDFDIDEASILEVLFEMVSGYVDVDLCDPFIEIPIELFISKNKKRVTRRMGASSGTFPSAMNR